MVIDYEDIYDGNPNNQTNIFTFDAVMIPAQIQEYLLPFIHFS